MTVTASDIEETTAAVNAAASLAKTAGPLIGMALQTFQQVVSANPGMLEPALKVVPQPFQGQIRAQMGQKKPKQMRQQSGGPVNASVPWPWIIGGGVIALGGLMLLRKKKKVQ